MAEKKNQNNKFLNTFNIPKHICKHTLGKQHSEVHHRVAGFIFMVIGVGIAHAGYFFELHFIRFAMDMAGYFMHGIGGIPFVVYFERMVNNG